MFPITLWIHASLAFGMAVDATIFKPQEYLPHADYVSREVFYPPVKRIRQDLVAQKGLVLRDRGEAHITLLAPPEYGKLKSLVPMREIDSLAKNMNIHASKFDVICIGEGRKDQMRTFYIVVKSEDLLNIRRAIAKAFIDRGGHAADFDPNHFYPHITLGFTDRDLHESDGVTKDSRTCTTGARNSKSSNTGQISS